MRTFKQDSDSDRENYSREIDDVTTMLVAPSFGRQVKIGELLLP